MFRCCAGFCVGVQVVFLSRFTSAGGAALSTVCRGFFNSNSWAFLAIFHVVSAIFLWCCVVVIIVTAG